MKKMELSMAEELGCGAEKAHGFKVKKWGVIPPKRRSVKRMMFDKFVSSVFSAFCLSSSSGVASTSQPKNCDLMAGETLKMAPRGKAKSMRIFPRKYHLLAITRQHDSSPK